MIKKLAEVTKFLLEEVGEETTLEAMREKLLLECIEEVEGVKNNGVSIMKELKRLIGEGKGKLEKVTTAINFLLEEVGSEEELRGYEVGLLRLHIRVYAERFGKYSFIKESEYQEIAMEIKKMLMI